MTVIDLATGETTASIRFNAAGDDGTHRIVGHIDLHGTANSKVFVARVKLRRFRTPFSSSTMAAVCHVRQDAPLWIVGRMESLHRHFFVVPGGLLCHDNVTGVVTKLMFRKKADETSARKRQGAFCSTDTEEKRKRGYS